MDTAALATDVVSQITGFLPDGMKILAAMVGVGIIPRLVYKFL